MISDRDELNFVTGTLTDFQNYFLGINEYIVSELLADCIFECYKSYRQSQHGQRDMKVNQQGQRIFSTVDCVDPKTTN